MFLQLTDFQSSCVANLKINADKHIAIVEYNNGGKYLYSNVDFSAMYDLIYRNMDSIGTWVIDNLKNNEAVQCVKL